MDFPQNPTQPARIEALAPAMLAVMALATVQPLVVILTTAMPLRPGDAEWRIRLFALLLGAAPQIAIALVVIAAIGLFSERSLVIRLAAFASLILAVLLIPIVILDVLDTLELVRFIPLDQVRRYKINALQSIGIGALMVPLLVWMARRALLAGRKATVSEVGHGLVVGEQPAPTGPLDPRVTN